MNHENKRHPSRTGKRFLGRAALLASTLFLTIIPSPAQEQETYKRGESMIESMMPPSPEPASAVKYVDVPFSHSQGLAELDVPIYTLRGRELSVPIGLRYRSGGIKLDEIAGVAGLGWTLTSGGCVTRVVMDMPDEFSSVILSHEMPSGTLLSDLVAKANTSSTTDYLRKVLWHKVDASLDRYSYDVLGLSGTFIIADDGEVIQLSGDGSSITYERADDNTIASFTIVGPDGTRHVLAERETASHDGSSDHPFTPTSGEPDKWTATTAWHLTSVTSASGLETASFTYTGGTWKRDVYVRRDDISVRKGEGMEEVTESIDHSFIASSYDVKAISSISLSGFTATFSYDTGTGSNLHHSSSGVSKDNYPFMLKNVTISAPGSNNLASVEVGTQRHAYDGRIILDYLRLYRSGTLDDRWNFEYDERDSNVSRFSQDWFGYYNGEDDDSHTRGGLCPFSFSPSFHTISLTSGHPDASKASYMSLLTANHDGARTVFSYEGNEVTTHGSEKASVGVRVKTISVYDGTKLARRRAFKYEDPYVDGHAEPLSNHYTTTAAQLGLSGTTMESAAHDWTITLHESPVVQGPSILDTRILYGKVTEDVYGTIEFIPLSLLEPMPVPNGPTARTVRHYSMSGIREGVTSTISRFPSTWKETYDSQSTAPTCADPWTGVRTGYSDCGPAGEALLTRQEEYGSDDGVDFNLLSSTDLTYSTPSREKALVSYQATQVMRRLEFGNVQFNDIYHYPVYASTCPVRNPISTHVVEYHASANTESTVDVTYTSSSNLSVPVRKESVSSTTGGVTRKMSYSYPDTWILSPNSSTLIGQHAFTVPLKTEYRVYQGQEPTTASKAEVTSYGWFDIDGVQRLLPASRQEFTDGVVSWTETILSRDCLGNVSLIKETGQPETSIVWSWNGLYPAAIVRNAGIGEVASAMGGQDTIDALTAKASPSAADLSSLSSALSSILGAHATAFSFSPGVGLTSVTAPSGMRTSYEYDNAGRLSAVKDGEGKTLESYQYNLLNGGDNRLSARHKTFRDVSGNAFSEDVTWWNTLGLATQDIAIAGAGDGRDLVTVRSGDFLLHDDVKTWLPYPAAQTGGNFQASAESAAKAFHSDDKAYYGRTYEKSTRERVKSESLPGYAGIHETAYSTDATTGFPRMRWSGSGVIQDGTYEPSEVTANIVTDADGRTRSVYADQAGRTLGWSAGAQSPTLYVYDNQDRLWAVAGSGIALSDTLSMWRYGYDAKGRLASKGIPGGERERYEYDDEDRVIRKTKGTRVIEYEYDAFGRILREYLATSPSGRTLLVENTYDSYPADAVSLLSEASVTLSQGPSKGLRTFSKMAEVGQDGTVTGYVKKVFLYDGKERPTLTVTEWPDGSVLEESASYSFPGEVSSSTAEFSRGGASDNMETTYSYDVRGRLTGTVSTLSSGGQSVEASTSYNYDEVGRPSGKNVYAGGALVMSATIVTAPQGWISSRIVNGASGTLFKEELGHDGTPSLSGISPSFAGKVTEKTETWYASGAPASSATEGYAYDQAGRLAKVRSSSGDVTYSHDTRGNILSIGRQANGLTFHYDGDLLTEAVRTGQAAVAFTHDPRGRVTHDGLAGLDIAYNHMDRVASVSSSLGESVEYSYLADSVKASALRPDGSGLVYRGPFVYVRAADGTLTLEGAPFDGGRLTPSGALAHVTDRLGSVRAVLDVSTGDLLEKAAYSAYGERSSLTSGEPAAATARRFRFTGQEDQGPDFGTPYTDFGARQYSPELGRWLTPEPLSEKYYGISPYAYCAGDPVNMVDRKGEFPDLLIDIASIALDVKSLAANVRADNVGGAVVDGVSLLLDGVAAAVPFVPGGVGMAVKAVRGMDKVADVTTGTLKAEKAAVGASKAKAVFTAGKEVTGFGDLRSFEKASEFGVDSYGRLKTAVKKKYGSGSGLEVHHLIEQRFAKSLGVNERDMAAIVLTHDEHVKFTEAWRSLIGYSNSGKRIKTSNATPEQIIEAAKDVYKDYPDLLKVLGID